MSGDDSGKMVRTSVTVPLWMKREMERVDANWSAVVRKAISSELEARNERDTIEAVLINERLRRKAPEGWDSGEAIRAWRRKR